MVPGLIPAQAAFSRSSLKTQSTGSVKETDSEVPQLAYKGLIAKEFFLNLFNKTFKHILVPPSSTTLVFPLQHPCTDLFPIHGSGLCHSCINMDQQKSLYFYQQKSLINEPPSGKIGLDGCANLSSLISLCSAHRIISDNTFHPLQDFGHERDLKKRKIS